ncbi:YqgQ family protein [Brevibacillus sp. B_LB10_24]|uniref:YqgQ family protein n=1 Tax=Brevibacillus sp. B_LB10_24 TaxID=3380645 RepID=UPI0038BA709D
MSGKPSDFSLDEFLRRFSIFIYTGDPEGDCLLIEDEIRELKQLGLIDNEEYMQAMIAVRQRFKKE